MSERALVDLNSEVAATDEFSETALAETTPGADVFLPSKELAAPAQAPSVQRSATSLAKVESTGSRQKMFKAMGKKYGNNYVARVAATLNSRPAAPNALSEENETGQLEHQTEPAAPAANANPAPELTAESAPAKPAAIQPPVQAAPTPAPAPAPEIVERPVVASAAPAAKAEPEARKEPEAGDLALGGDGDGTPNEDEENSKKNKNAPLINRQKADGPRVHQKAERQKAEQAENLEKIERTTDATATTIQRTVAPLPEAPTPTPIPTAEQSPNYQALKTSLDTIKTEQKTHGDAETKVSEAQNAATPPSAETTSHAEANKTDFMATAEPADFDQASFQTQVETSVNSVQINPENDLRQMLDAPDPSLQTAITTITTNVDQGQTLAKVDIQAKTDAPLDTATNVPIPATEVPATQTEYTPEEAGQQPTLTVGADVQPTPQEDVATTLAYGPQHLEEQMGSTEALSAEQFQGILDNAETLEFAEATTAKQKKDELDEDVEAATQSVTDYQTTTLGPTFTASLQTQADAGIAQAQTTRTTTFTDVSSDQSNVKSASEDKRQLITTDLNEIYTRTENLVRPLLTGLRDKVVSRFNELESSARETFVNNVFNKVTENRESGSIFEQGWNRTVGRGDLERRNQEAYDAERIVYRDTLKNASTELSTLIRTDLDLAKSYIDSGKVEVQNYIAGLEDAGLRQVAQETAAQMAPRFTDLETQIDDKYTEMESLLTEQYDNAVADLELFIQDIIAANRNILDEAYESMNGALDIINQMAELLLQTAQKGMSVIGKILENPGQFLTGLGETVRLGVQNFIDNLGTHLVTGLQEWLFGNLTEAGLTLPSTFDLSGAIDIALQVMGINYEFVRSLAVTAINEVTGGTAGDTIMTNIENLLQTAQEIADSALFQEIISLFNALRTGGLEGLITQLTADISTFLETAQNAFIDWLTAQLPAALVKIATWLIPGAGQFIQICQGIVTTIQNILDNASRIMSLVNAILDTLEDLANGVPAENLAGMIEEQLANGLSMAIDFLLGLVLEQLGITDLPGAIRGIIEGLQEDIRAGIHTMLVRLLRAIGVSALTNLEVEGGGEVNVADIQDAVNSAQTDDRKTVYKEQTYITRPAASAAATQALGDERLTAVTTLEPVEGAALTWDYQYRAGEQQGTVDGLKRSEELLTTLQTKKEEATNAVEAAKIAIRNAQSMSEGQAELADFRQELLSKLDRLGGAAGTLATGDLKAALDEADALYEAQTSLEVLVSTELDTIEENYQLVKEGADLIAAETVPVDDELIALFDDDAEKARAALRLFGNRREKLVAAMGWFDNEFDTQIEPRLTGVQLNGDVLRFCNIVELNFLNDAANMMQLEADLQATFDQLVPVISYAPLRNNGVATTEFCTFVRDATLNVEVEGELRRVTNAEQVYHRWRDYKETDELMQQFGLNPANAQDKLRFTRLKTAYLPLGGIPKMRTTYADFTRQFVDFEQAFTNFSSNATDLESTLDVVTRSGLTVKQLLEAWDANGTKVKAVTSALTGTTPAALLLVLNNLKTGGNLAGTGAKLDTVLTTANATATVGTFITFMETNLESDVLSLHNLMTTGLMPQANYADFATWVVEGKQKVRLENNKWGASPNKPSEDAYYSKLQFDLTNLSGGVAVLGNFGLRGAGGNSTGIFMTYNNVWIGSTASESLDIMILDVAGKLNWSINVNFSWIQGIIERAGRFLMIADLDSPRNTPQNPTDPMAPAPSVTAREVAYIQAQGYTRGNTRGDGLIMTDPELVYYYGVSSMVYDPARDFDFGSNSAPLLDEIVDFPTLLNLGINATNHQLVYNTVEEFEAGCATVASAGGLAGRIRQRLVTSTSERRRENNVGTAVRITVEPWGTSRVPFVRFTR